MPGFQGLFGTVTARNQRIVDFESFILSHVPYGRVDPEKNIQIGLIEYDGPKVNLGLVTKPLLAWHFGGIAHPITKAARVEYTYSYGDGTGLPVKASLLLGFQTDLNAAMLKPSPQIAPKLNFDDILVNAIGRVSNDQLQREMGIAAAAQANNVVTGSPQGCTSLNDLIDAELLSEPADAAAARSVAIEKARVAADLQSTLADANYARDEAQQAANNHPSILADPTKPDAECKKLLDKVQELSGIATAALQQSTDADQTAKGSDAIALAREGVAEAALNSWADRKRIPVIVAFDGPAQDNNSLNPFNYTPQTLFNDKEKYAQVLWWYFGGKAYRVTKAIRVPIRTDQTKSLVGEDVQSLFIGFGGPGGDNTA
jgi:hypothetical protein